MATPKILIADDDANLLSVLALHLRNDEYDVVCANSGEEVIAAAAEELDLLVLNVNLTLPDGTGVYVYVSDDPKLLAKPVIYLVPERVTRGHAPPRLPAQAMIRKPVPVSELLRKISAALDEADGQGEHGSRRDAA